MPHQRIARSIVGTIDDRTERPAGLRLDVAARELDGERDLVFVGGMCAAGVDLVVDPGRKCEVDLAVKHQVPFPASGRSTGPRSWPALPVASHLPALQLQALIDRFTAADVHRAMHGHVLAEATVHGTYTLNPKVAVAS